LRNAITELDRTKVESHMDEVATKMQETGELHKSLALQDQILSDIENLLQVLQDKKSLDKIDQMLEQMKNTLEGIDSLKKEQESLLNETRDTDKSRTGSDPSKSANPKMAEVAKKLNDLAAKQDALRAETESKTSDAMRQAEQGLSSLPSLNAAQEAALQKTKDSARAASKGAEGQKPDATKPGTEPTPGEKSPPDGTKPGVQGLAGAIEALSKKLEAARERTKAVAEGKPSPDGADP